MSDDPTLFALAAINPAEHTNIRYGRVLEAAEIAGLTAQRCFDITRQLLESGDWQHAGDGFATTSDFIRSVPFARLGPTVELVREFERLAADHGASQRAIGQATGQDQRTVGRHLGPTEADASLGPVEPGKHTADQGKQEPLDVDPPTREASASPDPDLDETEAADQGKQIKLVPEPPGDPDEGQEPMVLVNEGDEWYTPRWLFDALGLEFAIDVCSPLDRTHVAVPATRWFTIEDDGLSQRWDGTVWCNPPYSAPEAWARRMIHHGDGLLLTHMPMNAGWCVDVWDACDAIRLFQAMDFVRPDGSSQRPGYWLQLTAFGQIATEALARLQPYGSAAANKRRVASPMWRPLT